MPAQAAPGGDESWKTQPGVRAVLLDDAGRVLLLRRPDKDPFYGGHWNLPGGAKDPGESFDEGAHRELQEETGLTAHGEGIVYPYVFPGGFGRAFLFRHPEGELRPAKREVAEAAWFDLDQLPEPLMPKTAEILEALAGTRGGPAMAELDVTATRVVVEQQAATLFAAWLKPWVLAIAREKGWGAKGDRLVKAISDEQHDRAMRELAGDRHWRDDAIPAFRGTDDEGEEVSFRVLERAARLGRAEAAKAILSDARAGTLPHGRSKGYRDKTIERLRGLARKNVRLVKQTTDKRLAEIAADAEAANVYTLLNKLYDVTRANNIAINTVAGGYVRGVADVLRDHGYRNVYSRTMGDDRVCRVCKPNEGRRWTLLQFLSTYPLHPRCRCIPHPHPTAPLESLTYRPTNSVKVVKSMLAHTIPLAAHGHSPALAELVEAIAPMQPPSAPGDDAAIAGLADVLEKGLKKRPSGKPVPAVDAPPFQPPQVSQLDQGNPEHLLAFGRAIHDHAQALPKGHPQRKLAMAQYHQVRKAVDEWHRKRSHGETPKLPKPPAWVMGGAAHLTNPREFELAIHQATTREQLSELAHYMDAYALNHKKAGADWDAAWHGLKLAIGMLPGEDGSAPTGPRLGDEQPVPGQQPPAPGDRQDQGKQGQQAPGDRQGNPDKGQPPAGQAQAGVQQRQAQAAKPPGPAARPPGAPAFTQPSQE